jgi:flagellar motor switch protein FliN/FliY
MNEIAASETQLTTISNGSIRETPPILDDITLDLRIEVGSAKMKISELLNLADGSIIKLQQKTTDPLIIYANDKPIARGQIISANGKYNIRII